MRLRQFLDDLLFMSKAQRNASFVLVVLLLIVLAIRVFIPRFVDNEDFSEEIFTKIERLKEKQRRDDSIAKIENDIKPFHFDPNTIGYADLLKLGFESKTASILINYRESGAVFQKAEDIKKVYGVDSAIFSTIKEYVLIPEKPYKKDDETVKVSKANIKKAETKEKRQLQIDEPVDSLIIDLNTADTTLLKKLRGIGSVFATRICNFRNYLGGFHSVEQLSEVYNLSEETYQSVFPYLIVDTNYIAKININFCSVDDLKKHPYCNYYQARDVIDYRSHNGEYKAVSDLLTDSVMPPTVFNKLKPYLTVKVEHPKLIK